MPTTEKQSTRELLKLDENVGLPVQTIVDFHLVYLNIWYLTVVFHT